MSRTGFGATQTRETTDQDARAHARAQVARTARRGEDPTGRHPADDLAWAFKGREDELVALERLAAEVREQKAEREERKAQARELQTTTEAVLAEWDAERREQAEAEARKRLGIK